MACAVCVGAYLTPYFYVIGPWRFVPSTLVIFATGLLVLGRDSIGFLGIAANKRELAFSVLLFVAAAGAAYWLLSRLVIVEPLSVLRGSTARGSLHQLFQVLNDELIMRAALITILLRWFSHPRFVILALALVSALGHGLAYELDGFTIGWPALTSLFALAVIANTLFVRCGHIWYGLALHYAWNLCRFTRTYTLDGLRLREGATFNYIEGNSWVVGLSCMAMVLVFGAYLSSARRDSSERVE